MSQYRLEVASAGDITNVIGSVKLLWTQLPDIDWERTQRELAPWHARMAKYGVILASRHDFEDEANLQAAINEAVERFTCKSDLVVDPFCGSSNVGQIALELGRNYYGCDISQIAIDRSEVRLSRWQA